jgi:hypothetical protein
VTDKKALQSDELVEAARETGELFHDEDGEPYADVVSAEPQPHHEILRIRSRTFRTWLAGCYYRMSGRPPGGQAMTDALAVLSAVAQFEGSEREVGLRIAAHGGAIYLDLADPLWRVVEIDTQGWRILDRSPVPFRRPRGMRALPEPAHGGSLEELRGFVNVVDDDQYRLLAGWLLASFRPSGPYIVLVLTGEQDSAKSTTARLLRLLIDPNEVGDRTLPRDDQSFAIAASNSWIASFDNVSNLADWQSDAIARLATGAGFGTRQLYSDDEEFLVHVARPVILNGIGGIVTRPDLMDRAVVIDLASIPDERRRPEDEFYPSFETARPRLLGALLAAASVAFDRQDQVVIKHLPRMADATRWITAAEGALRWPERSFLAAYHGNRTNSRALTLEASPLAAPINRLIELIDWTGSATELLKALEDRVGDEVIKRRDWPKTAQQLGTELRRLAPDLRRVEKIEITFATRHGSGRTVLVVRNRDSMSQPSQPSQDRDNGDNDLHSRTTNGAEVHACERCGHGEVQAPSGAWVCTNSPGHPTGTTDLMAAAPRVFVDDLVDPLPS